MLIIQASNIHEGGSKTLLISFLEKVYKDNPDYEIVLFLDQRFDLMAIQDILKKSNIVIKIVLPKLISRLFAELRIWHFARTHKNSRLLCFGNIPPLFHIRVKKILFFQTVLYFEEFNKFILDKKTKLKFIFERCWIEWRISSVDQIYVQSSFIKSHLISQYRVRADQIIIHPFVDLKELKATDSDLPEFIKKGFFYPAIGTLHKNHKNLIDAWILLAKDKIFPELIITIDSRFVFLLNYLEMAKQQYDINYTNLGYIPRELVLEQLKRSEVMIFPSLCESFGLPLLEARENNIQIIASELDFVRDIVKPAETFNPASALSIARAVKRFLKICEEPIIINEMSVFVHAILNK